MSGPALFYGSADAGAIHRAETGYQDAGQPIDALILPPPAEPASIHGDASFGPLWLSFVWTAAATITLTPIVSRLDSNGVLVDTELTDEEVEITLATAASPRRQTFKVNLRYSMMDDATEIARQAVRGERFSVKVEMVRTGAGLLMLAGFSLGVATHTDQLTPANVETE